MSKFNLYSEVQLAIDLPELRFIKGDVATIVEIINNGKGKAGYCLEFFDNHGKTLDVAVVDESSIQPPLEHGIVNYRALLIPDHAFRAMPGKNQHVVKRTSSKVEQ